jgi:uncharacterized protein
MSSRTRTFLRWIVDAGRLGGTVWRVNAGLWTCERTGPPTLVDGSATMLSRPDELNQEDRMSVSGGTSGGTSGRTSSGTGSGTSGEVTPEVREDAAHHRFEIWVGDKRAGMTVYRGGGELYEFLHTEIDGAFGGRGLGSILIRQTLETVRARGAHVLPFCPFVKAFIAEHPEYVDLVPVPARERFGLSS